MVWLHQQGVVLPLELLPLKLKDRHCDTQAFVDLLTARSQSLQDEPKWADEFRQEMRRFLPNELVKDTVEQPAFWQYLTVTVADESHRACEFLQSGGVVKPFKM